MTAQLADLLRATADPAVQAAAERYRMSPWRIAVVGRTSAGKSTLVHRATGSEACATGLGGVTHTLVEVNHGGHSWIDTPGIDGTEPAIACLAPLLSEVDACVWVIDGLQPLTSSERSVLCAVLPDRLPLLAVVSRADLIGEEVDSVLERVRILLAPFSPKAIWADDLRRDAPVPEELTRRYPTPGRDLPLRTALEHLLSELASAPTPESWAALRAWWRSAVRAPDADAVALAEVLRKRPELHGIPLRVPEFQASEAHAIPGLLGGESGRRRRRDAEIHRWATEIDLMLVERFERRRNPESEKLAERIRALLPELMP